MKEEEKEMKTMMKIIAAVLTVAMLMTSAALAAGKIKMDGTANLRKGASTEYAKVGTVKAGRVLNFDKTKKDDRGVIWYHVKGGWVSSKNTTQIDGSVDSTKKSVGKTTKTSGSSVNATGDVKLRKGPGLDYAENGMMKAGKTAKFLGSTKKDARGVVWYKVSFNGKTGWVSSKYSKLRK